MNDRTTLTVGLGLLAMATALAGGCREAEDVEEDSAAGASSASALTGGVVYDDFESTPTGTGWVDGSVHGRWTSVWNGGGSVGVEQTTAGRVMHLRPKTASSASATYSSLVRSNDSFGDGAFSVRARTVGQLRSPPNAWEVSWFAWHYTDPDHFYYVILKPNGWELGKRDPAYPGGQRFLATGSSPAFPIGPWHTIDVTQAGGSMQVVVDGARLASFTDAERPYLSGSLALYSEDAHVHFDDVRVDVAVASADAGAPPPPPPSSERLYGVTVDDVSRLPDIVTSLSRLPHKATTRIVFDEFVPAADYVDPVTKIGTVSFTMGELLDSFYVPKYTTSAYLARTDEYLAALGGKVDIWEVGNEINGEWLGSTASVVEKVSGAYDKVKAAGKKTALTLYYNQGCWERADHEMFTWVGANIPARMKQGLDYVLVSYYEDDCNGLQPDWNAVFERLGTMFPTAKLGIGESGTTLSSKKVEYIQRYYGMQVNHPRFVGGAFWWYFREDMVPYTNPLWSTIAAAMK